MKIKSFILFIFVISIQLVLIGQIKKQDVLNDIAELKAEGDISKASELMNKLAFDYWQDGEETKALELFSQSVSINKELRNDNAIKIIYGNMGAIYSDLGQIETSIFFYRKSLMLSKKTKDKQNTGINLLNIGVSLKKMQRFSESAKNIEQALEIFNELGNDKFIRRSYGELYEVYDKLGEKEKSKEYLDRYINYN
jgi:tetratricopeptide (TPR) repeat protein